MHARRDRSCASVGARAERGYRWSSHGSQQAQIEPAWGNNCGEKQHSPGSPLETPGSREHHIHSYSIRDGQRSDNGNAAVPARGLASRWEGAAFITARGGNESEMETARDTARGMETARDTARGSETDYMSTVEPDTGRRSTSTAFEVRTCTRTDIVLQEV